MFSYITKRKSKTGEQRAALSSEVQRTSAPSYLLYQALRKRKQSEGDPERDGTCGYPDHYEYLCRSHQRKEGRSYEKPGGKAGDKMIQITVVCNGGCPLNSS